MTFRYLAAALFMCSFMACDDGGDGDDNAIEIRDCRWPDRVCAPGEECAQDSYGDYVCMDPSEMNGGRSAPDANGQGNGQGMRDAGSGDSDMMLEVPDCATTCRNAISCLYEADVCRPLTPGEERDMLAQCEAACVEGRVAAAGLVVATCSEQAEAILSAVSDLTLLCGISTAGNPCRTETGDHGVCVLGDVCDGSSDPQKCLGDAVCCVGIGCGTTPDSGVCQGVNACDGRLVDGECPGQGTGCCAAFADPGGACETDSQCSSDVCATEMGVGIPTPNGFCLVPCESDEVCGDNGICMGNAGQNTCFQRCGNGGACREGWFCSPSTFRDANGLGRVEFACVSDCRQAGCGLEGVCNLESGQCEHNLPENDCPFPCGDGEVCEEERCVRPDDTCDSDYNCPQNYECVNGQCETGSFADCNPLGLNTCSAGQTCVQTQEGGGVCLVTCAGDSGGCPIHMTCQMLAGQQLCYYEFCDGASINGACNLTSGETGTCRPLAAASQLGGICLNAGTAPAGNECDAEASPRVPEEVALSCAPGSICLDDLDDPLDPNHMNDDRGVCTSLCAVGGNDCEPGLDCVQFGRPDDPNTMDQNELFNLGFCMETECTALGDECPMGETCDPITFGANFGTCRALGERGLGEACERNEDCGANTFCANGGHGNVCLALCSFRDQDCPWGQSCVALNGGAVSACL